MKNLKYILLVILITTQAFAKDGTESGGGGNGYVCFTNPDIPRRIKAQGGDLTNNFLPFIKKIEILDLDFAKKTRGWNSEISPEIIDIETNESPFDYVEKIAKRFEQNIPKMATIIRDGIKRFTTDPNNFIKQPHGLQKISDAREGELPSMDCVLVTLARQYEANLKDPNTDFFLEVDQRLFYSQKHSRLSQAVTLLHEAVYSHARISSQVDSRNTRLLVALLIRKTPSITIREFISKTQKLGFDIGLEVGSMNYQQVPKCDDSFLQNRSSHYITTGGLPAMKKYVEFYGKIIDKLSAEKWLYEVNWRVHEQVKNVNDLLSLLEDAKGYHCHDAPECLKKVEDVVLRKFSKYRPKQQIVTDLEKHLPSLKALAAHQKIVIKDVHEKLVQEAMAALNEFQIAYPNFHEKAEEGLRSITLERDGKEGRVCDQSSYANIFHLETMLNVTLP